MRAAAWFEALRGEHLVAALAHSLWQGALVSLILVLVLRGIPAAKASVRYGLCCAALAAMVGGVAGTAALLAYQSTLPPATAVLGEANLAAATPSIRRDESTPSTQSATSAPSTRPAASWHRIAGDLWLLGVALMLLRALRLQWRTARLPRTCEPVRDPVVLALVADFARQLGVTRPLRVLSGPSVLGPAVLGWLSPVILLPASALAGIPEPLLRAAIAHELAHIRRCDYLINQIQILVEALLFFNPAVWWISRQIRIEREACCDALAVRALGSELDYAKSLAAWGALAGAASAPALAMTSGSRGSLLDRVRRLLDTRYVPALSRSWLGAVLLCGVAVAILAALTGGSFLATFALARALTPAERLAALESVAKQYAPGPHPYNEEGDPDRSVPLRVRVVSENGTIPPEDTRVVASVDLDRGNNGYSAGYQLYKSEGNTGQPNARNFEMNVIEGTGFICATAPGYAHAFAGPIVLERETVRDDIELVLKEGFTASLKVLGAEGAALAGVALEGHYDVRRSSGRFDPITDTTGTAIIEHCADAPLKWTVAAPGYEWEQRTFTHKPGVVDNWTLTPSLPARGTVYNEASGMPLPNVTLYTLERIGGPYPMTATPDEVDRLDFLGTTDSDGRFTLDTLRQDTQYTIMAVATSGARDFLRDVHAGDNELTLTMLPNINVRGVVRGALDRLPHRNGQPELHFHRAFESHDGPHHIGTRILLDVEGGTGGFELTELWPGKLEFDYPGGPTTWEVVGSVDDLLIEIPPESGESGTPAEREVIIRFNGTGSAPPAGAIRVNHRSNPGSFGLDVYGPYPVRDGEIRLTMPVPNTIGPHPSGLLGYWFQRKQVDVPPGEEPFVTILETVPAGSIHGTLKYEDGATEREMTLSLAVVEEPVLPGSSSSDLDIGIGDSASGESRTFMATPLPFGGTYRVLAWRSPTYVVSPKITLSERHPMESVELVVPEGESIRGAVLSEGGTPLAGVNVRLEFLLSDRRGSYGGPGIVTDKNGVFSFDGVNPEVDGTYSLVIRSMATHCGLWVRDVAVSNKISEYRLSAGITVTGTVQGPDGEPVALAKVQAIPKGEEEPRIPMEECMTTETGTFTFPNLCSGHYSFMVSGDGLGWMILSDTYDTRVSRHFELRAK